MQSFRPDPRPRNLVGCARAASDAVVAHDPYSAGACSVAGTVVVWVVASAEKEWCRREHELDMTEYVLGAAVAAVAVAVAVAADQVLGTMNNVDIPVERKVDLEYMQDE